MHCYNPPRTPKQSLHKRRPQTFPAVDTIAFCSEYLREWRSFPRGLESVREQILRVLRWSVPPLTSDPEGSLLPETRAGTETFAFFCLWGMRVFSASQSVLLTVLWDLWGSGKLGLLVRTTLAPWNTGREFVALPDLSCPLLIPLPVPWQPRMCAWVLPLSRFQMRNRCQLLCSDVSLNFPGCSLGILFIGNHLECSPS